MMRLPGYTQLVGGALCLGTLTFLRVSLGDNCWQQAGDAGVWGAGVKRKVPKWQFSCHGTEEPGMAGLQGDREPWEGPI